MAYEPRKEPARPPRPEMVIVKEGRRGRKIGRALKLLVTGWGEKTIRGTLREKILKKYHSEMKTHSKGKELHWNRGGQKLEEGDFGKGDKEVCYGQEWGGSVQGRKTKT